MRRKLISMVFVVLMVFGLLPGMALADPGDYNAHDVAQIKTFLEQASAVAGKTNAEQLGYDVNDPDTWTDVFWYEQRLTYIDWNDRSLAGSLDLTGCEKLGALYIQQNAITSLILNGCTGLSDLDCKNNAIETLDLRENPLLHNLECSNNKLSALDLTAQTSLGNLKCGNNMITSLSLKTEFIEWLYCENNKLTSLDLKAVTFIRKFNCKNNALTVLDLSKYDEISELDVSGNKLTALKAVIENKNIELKADGAGFVGLAYVQAEMEPFSIGDGMTPMKGELDPGYFYAEAVPAAPSTFVRWMDADAKEISKIAKIDLTPGQSYVLTAKFLPPLTIDSSVSSGQIYTSGRITLTPSIPGGTWTWDETFFTATFNSPATFTALRSGTSRVTYTVEGMSTHYDITAIVADLPATGQDYTWFYILGGLAAGALILAGLLHRRNARV